MLTVNTNQNISSSRFFERQQSETTYIMQGNAEKKELDVYHLILAPTYECNLRCKHCYLPDHGNDLLPRNAVLRLIDEWREIVIEERGQWGGIFHVKGGEPFMVPYLWDIIDRLVELQSLHLMLTTNGTLSSEDIFGRLSNCRDRLDGHLTVVVSLDGATEESNTRLRGKGQFIKTMKFLNGLQRDSINFYLNCVLHKGNIDELSAYVDLAKRYRATQVNFLSLIPRGNGKALRDWQLPHTEIYQNLKELFKAVDSETKRMLAGSLPDIKYQETLKGYPISGECVAAYRGLYYIIPDGSVFTCPNITFNNLSVGNVYQKTLREISDNLTALYEQIKTHNGAFVCTGEKIFYEMSCDSENYASLNAFHESLNDLEDGNPKHSYKSSTVMSYCYNRNW